MPGFGLRLKSVEEPADLQGEKGFPTVAWREAHCLINDPRAGNYGGILEPTRVIEEKRSLGE